jgi:hypothetical protein
MAGFSDKPFHLKRNEVAPSIELQRLVFDFVENAFGEEEGSEENRLWRLECDNEMMEMDVNNEEDLENIEPYGFTPGSSSTTSHASSWASMSSNKKFVLKTLLRLRRVLLQDAAEYLYRYKPEQSPLLQAHSLFTHPLFKEFKIQVHKALDRPVKQIPNNLPPNVISALDAWYRETHAGLAEANRKMEDLDERMVTFETLFRTLFSHTSWSNNMMRDIKADTASMRGTQPSLPPPPPTTFMHSAAFTPDGQSPIFAHGSQTPVMSSTYHPPASRPNHHQKAISTQIRPIRPALAPQPPRKQPSPPPIPTFPVLGRGREIRAGTREATESGLLSQSVAGSSDGPSTGGSAPVLVPASVAMPKQWFVPAARLRSTRALHDEYLLFLDLSAPNKKSDLTGKAIKQISNRKAVYDQIIHLRTRNIAAGLSEKDALEAACREIDNKVRDQIGATAGDPYSKNQAFIYCRNERIRRYLDEGKVIRNRGRTKKANDDGSASKGKGKSKSKDKKKSNEESDGDNESDDDE